METKEIIDTLRICADGDIICSACQRYERSMNYGSAYCFYELMLEADDTIESQQKRIAELEAKIREQEERENPKPLTLYELRNMDGPVWCLCKPIEGGNGFWCLCKNGRIITPSVLCFDIKEIPNWTFLRYKPKEDA